MSKSSPPPASPPNEEAFWEIIESAGSPDQCDPEQQCEEISAVLESLSKSDLVSFENIRNELLQRSYTWPMVKACFIVLSYVSDDVFEDFQHWVILNGRSRFTAAVENPDTMADFIDVDDPVEEICGEPLLYVVQNVWEGDIEEIEEEVVFLRPPDLPTDWPDKSELRKEFPKLFDRYWNEDRIQRLHPN